MSGKYRRMIPLSALIVASAACNNVQTTTEMQHTRMDEARSAPRAHLSYMVDNATLHDMSLADLHFVPHTAELSGSGIVRLDRMAVLLDTYGGTVRYDTALTNEAVIQQRLKHVGDYLATTGCDMDRVKIEAALPGGRGMRADDAIEGKERAAEESRETRGAGPAALPMPGSP